MNSGIISNLLKIKENLNTVIKYVLSIMIEFGYIYLYRERKDDEAIEDEVVRQISNQFELIRESIRLLDNIDCDEGDQEEKILWLKRHVNTKNDLIESLKKIERLNE